MGYVDSVVQTGLAIAKDKGVAEYVEKARSVKALNQVVDLVKAHGPELVATIDRKVDETLGNVNERKTKVIDQVNETKSKVYNTVDEKKELVLNIVNEKTTLVLETVDVKKAQVLVQMNAKKATVCQKLDVAQQKKDEYVKLAYDVVQEKKDCALVTASEKKALYVQRATSCYDEAAEKKAELMKTLLTRTEGTQFAAAAQYFVLMTDVAIVKGDNLVRKGLRLPQTLQERMEGRSIEQAREYVLDFGREKIYRPLSLHTNTVAMFVVNGKLHISAVAAEHLVMSREFLLQYTQAGKQLAQHRYADLVAHPRMVGMDVYVAKLASKGEDAKLVLEKYTGDALALKEKAMAKAADCQQLVLSQYATLRTELGERSQVLLVLVQRGTTTAEEPTVTTTAEEPTVEPVEPVASPVSEEGFHEKLIKQVKKEGGKKGSELAGAADMGGIEWFTTTCETPKGEPQLLEIVNQEMNVEVDPAAEETKGGSARVAKCLLSAGDKQLAFLCYVPAEKHGAVTAKQWINELIVAFGDYGEIVGNATDTVAVAVAKLDAEEGKFPLKLRDAGIGASIAFLKSKGLFPDDDDDDSDEMVFGDDDFPCDQE